MRFSAAFICPLLAALTLSAQSGPAESFDEALKRLKTGRAYDKQPTGWITLPSIDRGIALENVLEVPADYNPARAWPLRVALHGGVGREAPGPGEPAPRRLRKRIPRTGAQALQPRAGAA